MHRRISNRLGATFASSMAKLFLLTKAILSSLTYSIAKWRMKTTTRHTNHSIIVRFLSSKIGWINSLRTLIEMNKKALKTMKKSYLRLSVMIRSK